MRTATLIINDEVNLKVSGLELDVRKKLVNTFKYDVPHARYLPAVRLGRWDGKVAYFQMGGSTYLNLLPDILPILEDFNYDIDIQDNREYQTVFKFDPVAEDLTVTLCGRRIILQLALPLRCVTIKLR